MTKKLEELFDLPTSANEVPITVTSTDNTRQTLAELDKTIDKIEAALPQVKGLELADSELDELSTLAVAGYKDLTDLGMQVDSRFAAEIFGVASNMLGHAITAKTAKLDKKLKMIDLQLKKMRLDQNVKTEDPAAGPMETAQGMVLSRNDLLERLLRGKDQNTQKE